MIDTFQKVDFIRNIHLFRGLKEEELQAIADKMKPKACMPGEVVVRQGDVGDRFYLIYSGRVEVKFKKGQAEYKLAELGPQDHFGEDALLNKQNRRTATVTTKGKTILLSLARDEFNTLLKTIRRLRSMFEVTASSHKLARHRHFTWQEKGEDIYFITRRHPILLWKSLTWPVLGMLLPAFSLLLFLVVPQVIILWLAGLSFAALGALTFFKWLDWSNDYYIVTNRRVVFLEKIILLYDSRQEAPLTAILSVNTQSDVTGRTFGYGDVIVRTFVGSIIFKTIAHPEAVEALVREYWERTKKISRQKDLDAMKETIRKKLGLVPPTSPAPAPKPATKPAYKFNFFKIRFEEQGIITYRKHWFVWFRQTWLPGLLGLLTLGGIIWDFFKNGVFGRDLEILTLLFFLVFLPILAWWWYQTVDWSNDKFQVTSDQIIDLDKTPFGRMQKNIAPLDNILNLEARREGLMQMFFNYGKVYISVGGVQMVFEDVINPDAVQQDIDQRRVARREKQERERAAAEREHMAEFFAVYHENMEEFQRELEEKAKEKKPDPWSEN